MNIVYSSSDSYAPIAGVSIMSLLHNNTDSESINIYMIDNSISAENKHRFEEMVGKYGRTITLYLSPTSTKRQAWKLRLADGISVPFSDFFFAPFCLTI